MKDISRERKLSCPDGNPESLLINTPSRDYGETPKDPKERSLTPYGVISVATDAQDRIGGVGMIDAEFHGMSNAQVKEMVSNTLPPKGVIGLNVITPSFANTIILAQEINDARSEATIVFGGPHATLDPRSILRYLPNAIIVAGDGERVFSEINKKKGERINGTVTREDDNIIYNGKPNVVRDLNELPWLNREFAQNEPYTKADKTTMTVLTSRGCAGACGFCITPAQFAILKEGGAKKVRFRDMEGVVDEVLSLVKEHGLQHVQFIDDEMLPSKKRIEEFLEHWNNAGLAGEVTFNALLRPDRVARLGPTGLVHELADAGLNKIAIGIETGYDRGRKMVSGGRGDYIDPKYNEKTVRTAIESAHNAAIYTKGFVMIGLPKETREEMRQTLDFMHSLKNSGLDKVALFPLKVYPATPLWNVAINMGFTEEELGHYSAPDVVEMIENGIDPVTASRDGYTQDIRLSEIPPDELNEICVREMTAFNEK